MRIESHQLKNLSQMRDSNSRTSDLQSAPLDHSGNLASAGFIRRNHRLLFSPNPSIFLLK